MSKYFLVTIYTCENAVFHESIIRVRNGYVSKDVVMNILAEGDVPKEIMPLFYTREELNLNGMIQPHELKHFKYELERDKKREKD